MGAHVSVPMYWRSIPQRLRLEGCRCTACGHVHFPPVAACHRCGAAVAPCWLSGRGRIHAVTYIAGPGAPPEFGPLARARGGYYVAIVELEEGPRITAQLAGFEERPAIGAPVRAVVRRLYEEEGVVRYGFKFVPASLPGVAGSVATAGPRPAEVPGHA